MAAAASAVGLRIALAVMLRVQEDATMDDDPFETVAIAYSQPQAGVLMSLFAWHGIPAYAMNLEMLRTDPGLTLALGGIPIRVARKAAEDARALLAEAEDRVEEVRAPDPIGERITMTLFCGLTGMTPPPKRSAVIVKR